MTVCKLTHLHHKRIYATNFPDHYRQNVYTRAIFLGIIARTYMHAVSYFGFSCLYVLKHVY